jgi:hypothetical protein
MDSGALDQLIVDVRAGRGEPLALALALAQSPLLFALSSPPGDTGRGQPWVMQWNGLDHGALFTSQEHFDAVPNIAGYAVLTGAQLAAIWPGDLYAAINPGAGDAALVLDAAAVRAWATVGSQGIPAGTEFAVGSPAQEPDPQLVSSLRNAVAASQSTEAAYIVALVAQGQVTRIVVGVQVRPGAAAREAAISLADSTAADYPPAAQIDFIPLSGELLRSVVAVVPAIRP